MGTGETTGVGRYIKGVTLGEGTYGVVFKAIDRVVQCCLLKTSNLAMVTLCWNFNFEEICNPPFLQALEFCIPTTCGLLMDCCSLLILDGERIMATKFN
jgi:hypothetical protein